MPFDIEGNWYLIDGKEKFIDYKGNIVTNDNNALRVGNGGFSLRTKEIMINVINFINNNDISDLKKELLNNPNIYNYMKNTNQTSIPEDIVVTSIMLKYNIGKIADWNTSSFFSSGQIHSPL